MAIEPYKINVCATAIAKLKHTFPLTDLPDELDEVVWDMGALLDDIWRLTIIWKN